MPRIKCWACNTEWDVSEGTPIEEKYCPNGCGDKLDTMHYWEACQENRFVEKIANRVIEKMKQHFRIKE
jgi:hypothetical protein